MSDLIKRQDAVDAVQKAIINHDSAIERIVNLPSAQPEVIAYGEVLKHLETTISEIQSTEMDQDCTMFCQGLTFATAMVKNHLKEVDNG